jgi:hypothetical protein
VSPRLSAGFSKRPTTHKCGCCGGEPAAAPGSWAPRGIGSLLLPSALEVKRRRYSYHKFWLPAIPCSIAFAKRARSVVWRQGRSGLRALRGALVEPCRRRLETAQSTGRGPCPKPTRSAGAHRGALSPEPGRSWRPQIGSANRPRTGAGAASGCETSWWLCVGAAAGTRQAGSLGRSRTAARRCFVSARGR